MIKEQAGHNDDEDNSFAETVKRSAFWGAIVIASLCMLATMVLAILHYKTDIHRLIVFIPIACNLITQVICFSMIITRAQKAVDAFGVK